jgi:hypothetical protein
MLSVYDDVKLGAYKQGGQPYLCTTQMHKVMIGTNYKKTN